MIRVKAALLTSDENTFEGRLRTLKRALQTAIELEHSTIPPYLYALYSIKTGANLEAATLIRSVVLQEMLHMSLDCNVLNAIGGHPKIDDPKFIPTYPGPLPGTVESGLTVPLAPLSKQLLKDVFMVIEEPEDTVDGEKPSDPGTITIGDFYQKIKEEIVALGKEGNIFTGNPLKQVVTGFQELQHLHVTDEKSALAAIDLIVAQGEGSRSSPDDPEHGLAHYYKYAEIYHGRTLIRNPAPHPPPHLRWIYAGHPIQFDPYGVQPVIVNPQKNTYAPGSRLASLNDAFNMAYSNLLRGLHQVFNGQPDYLGPALLTMQGLKDQAQVMMSIETVPGQTAGPTFNYVPA